MKHIRKWRRVINELYNREHSLDSNLSNSIKTFNSESETEDDKSVVQDKISTKESDRQIFDLVYCNNMPKL